MSRRRPTHPRHRRRPADALPLLFLLALATGAWVLRDRWLPPGAGANGAPEVVDEGAADGAAAHADPAAVPGATVAEGTNADADRTHGTKEAAAAALAEAAAQAEAVTAGRPSSDRSGGPPADATAGAVGPGAGSTADAGMPGAAESGSGPSAVESSPGAVASGVGKAAGSASDRNTLDNTLAATASGAPPDDEALAQLVDAWRQSPADEQALLRLVGARRARNEIDQALEEIVRFAEAGGSPEVSAAWIAQLDPFVETRRALLLTHAARLVDEGLHAFRKQAWIEAAGLLRAAEILAGSVELGPVAALALVRQPPGASAAAEAQTATPRDGTRPWQKMIDGMLGKDGAELAPAPDLDADLDLDAAPDLDAATAVALALAAARERLYESHDAVKALATYGIPLPPEVSAASRLRRLAAERRDERLARKDAAHELVSKHHVVQTRIGSLLANQIITFLEQLYDSNRERFAHDPLAGDETLRVEILTDPDAFDSRRTAAEPMPHPSVRAFHEVRARHVVVLDPRATGASFEELWGLLAREATRIFVRPPNVGPFDLRAGSPWIEAAMCIDRMGARRLADGRLVLDRLPQDAWRVVRRAFADSNGRRRPNLVQVLTMERHDKDHAPWAWALGWFLSESVGDDGQPRFAEKLTRLIAAVRGGSGLSPMADFQRWILAGAPNSKDADDLSVVGLDASWERWLERQAALDRGDDEAIAQALGDVREHLDEREHDLAEGLLRRVLVARPDAAEALALRIQLGKQRRRTDEALVAARLLAQSRLPSGNWRPAPEGERLPIEAREMSERIRWAEAIGLRKAAGELAATNDLALRAGVESQIDTMLADGYPLAAVRQVETLLVVWPLDAGYRAMRAAILEQVLDTDAVTMPRPISWPGDVSDHGADATLWWPQEADLVVRCSDRVLPTTLRGIVQLVPPCRVELSIRFERDDEGRVRDDGTRFAGLLLGAETPTDYGSWGLFVTPGGRIELARRGHLEWPSESIGRSARGGLDLTLELGGQHFEVFAEGKSLGRIDLGVRPAAGWLGLFVRHADVTFTELTVTSRRQRDPSGLWSLGLGR